MPKDVIREFTRARIDEFAIAGDVTTLGDGMTLFDYRFDVPEDVRIKNQILKSITFEFVIRDHRTTTVAFKGREILKRLFEALYENASGGNSSADRFVLFPRELRPTIWAFADDEPALARAVCDHLASLTEGQALSLYGRLFEPEVGSPLELV